MATPKKACLIKQVNWYEGLHSTVHMKTKDVLGLIELFFIYLFEKVHHISKAL